MLLAGVLLGLVLLVFSLGKSPVFRLDRAGAAILAAALTTALGVLTFEQAVKSVDYRTIVVLFSMMIIVASLRASGFFRLVGSLVLRSVATQRQLLLAVIVASGLLSAFFINDVVCLLFAPIVILICREVGCDARPHLLGVALAANLGSAATFLGNPQNILIASLSGVPFLTYSLTAAPVALAGLFVSYLTVLLVFRKEVAGAIPAAARLKPRFHRPLVVKSLVVLALVVAGYIAGRDLAVMSSLGAAVLLLTRRVKPEKIYAAVDFNLLVMFAGLFVVVGGVEASGLTRWVAGQLGVEHLRNLPGFAAITVALSNLVSNVPAVMLLRPFLPTAGAGVWWQALALFSTFAGNLTVTGSVANLIVLESARREKIHIGFWDYLKVGLPVTLLTSGLGLLAFARVLPWR
jgi:Na+/H+ antiporter NhaD/arsenite permease-like protein